MKSVKIGPQVFKICIVKDLEREDGTKLDGWIRYNESTISLDAGLSKFRQKETLWHEIMHAVADQSGVELSEKATDGMAWKIIEILDDNQWLLEYHKKG